MVRGQLTFVRRVGEKAFTSVEAAAWLVKVEGGKLRSVRAFRNAPEAERAAAFSAEEPTRDHLLGRFLLPLVRRLLAPARRSLTSSA